MEKIIQRQKATLKIEIIKTSQKKVNIKVSRYSTASSDMTNEERVKHFKAECFDCPDKPLFIEELSQKFMDCIRESFNDKGVEEFNCEREILIYK